MVRSNTVRGRFRSPAMRSLSYAVVGAMILLTVEAAFNIRDLQGPGLLSYMASAVVGAIVGWIYDLGTRMNEVTRESIEKMKELSQILEFQQRPLRLLAEAKVHAATVGILLKESIGEQYRTITAVDSNRYMWFLRQAIDNSMRFHAVMRNRIRWWQDNSDGESYLRDIAGRRMKERIRIFIINDDQVLAMQEDLADPHLMDFYWRCTGPVDTFWIGNSDLLASYSDLKVPDDFALFDSELLICYDSARQTVFFDIVDEHALERRVFAKLQQQLQNKRDRPFVRVKREVGTVRRLRPRNDTEPEVQNS
jgi:hypothetical protein